MTGKTWDPVAYLIFAFAGTLVCFAQFHGKLRQTFIQSVDDFFRDVHCVCRQKNETFLQQNIQFFGLGNLAGDNYKVFQDLILSVVESLVELTTPLLYRTLGSPRLFAEGSSFLTESLRCKDRSLPRQLLFSLPQALLLLTDLFLKRFPHSVEFRPYAFRRLGISEDFLNIDNPDLRRRYFLRYRAGNEGTKGQQSDKRRCNR